MRRVRAWMRFRVTATQWLLWCAGVRPQPEFRRQEADIGSRCKRATIGGKCIPNFQRDSRKLWGYLLRSGYHVPLDRRIDIINPAGWLAHPTILTQPLHTPEDLIFKALIWRIERSFSLSAGHWAGFTSQPNSCKSENREKCGFSLHIRIHKFWNCGGNHMFLYGNFPLVLTIENPRVGGSIPPPGTILSFYTHISAT